MRNKSVLLVTLLVCAALLSGCGKNNGDYDYDTTFPSGNTGELRLEFSTPSPTAAPTAAPTVAPTVAPTEIPAAATAAIPAEQTAAPASGQTVVMAAAQTSAPAVTPPVVQVTATPQPTVYYANEAGF